MIVLEKNNYKFKPMEITTMEVFKTLLPQAMSS